MQTKHMYKAFPFFLIAFLFTWIPAFTAAYFSYQKEIGGYQMLLLISAIFGPSISALFMVLSSKNKKLREDFWDRLRFSKIHLHFLPVILLIVPTVVLLATALSLIFGYSTDQFLLSKEYQVLREHGLISLVILALAPTFEELGWRGYGVDSLRSSCNIGTTSLLFGLLWALWHLPLFFIKGYYHHELWNMNILYVFNFILSVLTAAFVMNWIYYKNGRSITAMIIFHFMLNTFFVIFRTEQFTKCIASALMLVICIYLFVRDKQFFLRKVVS